jgi:hypothetical protein
MEVRRMYYQIQADATIFLKKGSLTFTAPVGEMTSRIQTYKVKIKLSRIPL